MTFTRWDYLTVGPHPGPILSDLGDQRWELVCVLATGVYVFKRPRREEPPVGFFPLR